MAVEDIVPETELLIWVGGPCVIMFGIIWFATCLMPTSKKKKPRVLVRKDSGHPFFDRTGLLDGGTPYLKSWRTNVIQNNTYNSIHSHTTGYFDFDTSSSALQKSMFRGWYNIAMLLIVSYIALHFISNYGSFGTLVSNTAFLWSLIMDVHELVIVILMIYFASFSVYFTQIFAVYFSRSLLKQIDEIDKGNNDENKSKHKKRELQSLISRTEWIRLFYTVSGYVCTIFILVITTLFVFYRTKHWPISQKAGLMLETVCLSLKAHSYLDTNNELFKRRIKYFRDKISAPKTAEKRIPQTQNGLTSSKKEMQDITKVKDIESLTDDEIESYLLAYGLKRNMIFVTNKTEQKKFLSKMKVQLELRNKIYPKNITLWDYILFTCTPTLCYSPIYPRTNQDVVDSKTVNLKNNIEWIYVIEKFIMSIGIIVCMYLIAESTIIPVLQSSNKEKFHESVVKLYFPFFCMFILGFFLVFDCILNASAEMTCFADRQFYSDWWNATSFMEFSRKWNVPVHEYLLRHIYLGVFVKKMKCSTFMAKTLTFLWSTIFHELVLTAITHRFKPWFSFFSLWQVPLMPIMDSPLFRNTQFGNILILTNFILGIAMIALLYAKDYVQLEL